MAGEAITEVLAQQSWLDPISDVVQNSLVSAYAAAGNTGQQVKNVLSGTWLGHPLHPALTDIPVGSFAASLVFDLLDAGTGRDRWAAAADATLGIGLLGATGAAISGLNDWQFTVDTPRRLGMAHALLNTGATGLYLTSLILRRAGARRWGRRMAYAAFGTVAFSAWIGGDLTLDQHIGVNHAPDEAPTEFVPVLDEATLRDGQPTRADANGIPVVLVREQGQIYALGETCSHLGGPLAEGAVSDGVITCPWHASQFALADGHIVNGPATFPQPCFQTRVRNGKVEVGPRCLSVPTYASSSVSQPQASGQAVATPT